MTTLRERITSIQAGRGLAALAVLLFHLSLMLGEPRYGGVAAFRRLTIHGNLGVEFFFVLSGFIILYAHAEDVGKPSQLRRYLYRRFSRLFPLYWVLTIALIAITVAGVARHSSLPLGFAGWVQTFTLIRMDVSSTPLAIAWTLFHELAFYIIFGIAIIHRRTGIAVLTMWLVACVIANQYPPEFGRTPIAVYTATYNIYFFFGMAAFWISRRLENVLAAALITWFSALALLLAISNLYLHWFSFRGGLIYAAIFGSGFALAIAGISSLERHGRFSAPRPLQFLGDASYAIYLTHLAFEGIVLKAIIAINPKSTAIPQLTFLGVAAATVIGGMVIHLYVERPILGWFRAQEAKALRSHQIRTH